MAKKTYIANWQLDHDGQTIEAGKPVTMDEKIAQPLLDCGVLSEKTAESEKAGE